MTSTTSQNPNLDALRITIQNKKNDLIQLNQKLDYLDSLANINKKDQSSVTSEVELQNLANSLTQIKSNNDLIHIGLSFLLVLLGLATAATIIWYILYGKTLVDPYTLMLASITFIIYYIVLYIFKAMKIFP
jgi:hypothetical protein